MNDEELLKKTREALDESVESIDASTLSQLNQARQHALQSKKSSRSFVTTWLPTSVVAAFVIAITVNMMPGFQISNEQKELTEQAFDDIDIIASSTELDLLEDLEFVSWLIEEQDAG